jgi:hypothetical protein
LSFDLIYSIAMIIALASQAVIPNAYRSLALVGLAASPCGIPYSSGSMSSGAIQRKLPDPLPVVAVRVARIAVARPKSVKRARPTSSTKTFV